MTPSPAAPAPVHAQPFIGHGQALAIVLIALAVAAATPWLYTHEGEDCFITFRYAAQQATGHGLVYNPGEWVEGYSNFTYTLWMVLPAWLGASQKLFAQWTNAATLAAMVLIAGLWAAVLQRRLALVWQGQPPPGYLMVAAPAFIALDPFLRYHVDGGLETLLFAALLMGASVASIAHRFRACGAFVGLAACTRPEGFVYLPAFALLALWGAPPRVGLRRIAGMSLTFCAMAAPLFVWRYLTYGGLLPNTVTAKVDGTEAAAMAQLAQWVAVRWWPWWLALAGFGWALAAGGAWRRAALHLVVPFALALAFAVAVGKLQNVAFRYMVPLMPFQMMGMWLLLMLLWRHLMGAADARRRCGASLGPLLRHPAATLAVLTVLVAGHHHATPSNTDGPETRFHRQWPRALTSAEFRRNTLEAFYGPPILLHTEAGRWVRANIPAQALLAADQMGQFGYAVPHHRVIDLLGLMDRHIARHGLSPAYLLQRQPDFLIIYTPLRQGRTRLPGIHHAFFDAPEVFERYELATILRPRDSIQLHAFEVWQRRDSPWRGTFPPVVWLGPDGREFFRIWRVHSDAFIRAINLHEDGVLAHHPGAPPRWLPPATLNIEPIESSKR